MNPTSEGWWWARHGTKPDLVPGWRVVFVAPLGHYDEDGEVSCYPQRLVVWMGPWDGTNSSWIELDAFEWGGRALNPDEQRGGDLMNITAGIVNEVQEG